MNRGDKIYLDKDNTKESSVNQYLSCRDGVVEKYSYNDMLGYGSKVNLFLCQNTKHEHIGIIRQTYNSISKEWIEEDMIFDTDSFRFLEALIKGEKNISGGKFEVIRDYSNN